MQIDFSKNKIDFVKKEFFTKFLQLSNLNLADNRIKTFDWLNFQNNQTGPFVTFGIKT